MKLDPAHARQESFCDRKSARFTTRGTVAGSYKEAEPTVVLPNAHHGEDGGTRPENVGLWPDGDIEVSNA